MVEVSSDLLFELAFRLLPADPRLRVVRSEETRLHPGGINTGVPFCRGEFVALMDHDDLSLPGRLARQLAFLRAHPEFDAVACLEREIDAPKNGAAYRNDVVLTHNTWYTRLRDGTLDVRDGDPVREPENVMVLGNVSPRTLQYVVRADSDIHTLEDLAGATALIPRENPEILELSDLVLLAAGQDPLAMDVASEADFESRHTSQQLLIDGDVDVYVLWEGVRNAELDHFERQGADPRVLEIPEEVVAAVGRVDPSQTNLTVEAGTLPGQDGDVNLMASWKTLYAHADLDEDLAYELVGAVYEELGDRIPGEVTATAEEALSGVDPGWVHPGAARYFSERGVL